MCSLPESTVKLVQYLLVQRCGNPALIQDSQELEIQAEPIFILASSTFDTTRRKGPS